MLKNLQQKYSITVYLKDDADPFEVGNVITELEQREDVVKPVSYTSKEQAWKLISKTFSLDTALLEKYKFSLPATLTITPRQLEDTGNIKIFLNENAKNLLKESLGSTDKTKNVSDQMINFIQNIKNSTLKTIVFFIILFVIGATFMIISSIHLAIATRHREITIMKLMGANYSKIIVPFVAEGFLISLFAGLINAAILAILPFETMETKLYLNLLLIEALASVTIGVLASYATTVFHIRKNCLSKMILKKITGIILSQRPRGEFDRMIEVFLTNTEECWSWQKECAI